jgi:hypothetical protein
LPASLFIFKKLFFMLKRSLPNFRVGKVLESSGGLLDFLPLPLAYQPQDDSFGPEGTISGTTVFLGEDFVM